MATVKLGWIELLAAGCLAAAMVGPAAGQETTGRGFASDRTPALEISGERDLAVPFADLPWMDTATGTPPTVDGITGGRVQTLGPFLLEPAIPPAKFSRHRQADAAIGTE